MSLKVYRVQGKARYAKILGAPPPGYDNGPAEWTFDLVLDEDGKKEYLATGGDKFYIKNKDGLDYIRFVRHAQKRDGSEAKPIQVVGPDGNEWDQKVLIGNDSILNVKFTLNVATHKKVDRFKPSVLAVQVWEHVKYVPKSDFPVKESNILEGASKAW